MERGRPRKAGPSSLLRRGVAGLTAIALAASAIPVAHSQETSPVSGKVFLDYGGDGDFTDNVDTLLGGVKVTAYDATGEEVGSTTSTVSSDGDPNYALSLNSSVAANAPLRIEFTNLPAGMYDSFNAAQSSVQFTVPGESVDYGVLDVNQYNPVAGGSAEANPTVSTAILAAGKHTHEDAADTEVLVATKWDVAPNVSGNTADFSQRTPWATYGEVGSVFSMAADSTNNRVFTAATYKRISDLGPEGLGGIYYVSNALDNAGNPREGDAPRGFDVVKDLGINVGQDLIVSRPALEAPNQLITDTNAFENVMKVGIGGLAIDSQSQILYFVNLYDKRVYAIDISNVEAPRLIGSIATLANDGQRAFALTLHQGQLYVGYNDTGESEAWRSAEDAGMKYYVDRIDALNRDASDFTGSWSNVLNDGDLSYKKGSVTNNWGAGNQPEFTAIYPQVARWNSWTDKWIEEPASDVNWDAYVKEQSKLGRTVGIFDDSRPWGHKTQVYPQPLLSGLAFDREGFLSLAFADRTGFQGGNRNWAAYEQPAQSNTEADLWESLSSGDLLIAAPESVDGTEITQWIPESNGVAGNRNGTGGEGEGPGSKEFYNDRQMPGSHHLEITLGSAVVSPGTTNLAASVYDPLAPVRVIGTKWFDAKTGALGKGYQHTQDPGDPSVDPSAAQRTSFQKGGGMGGLALLVKSPPVEIGNLTWLDLDGDGIQDADEPVIEGTTVELFAADADGNPTGEALATKLTDANGNYFFRSEDAATEGTPGFTPNGEYVVVFAGGAEDAEVTLHWPNSPPADFEAITWGDLSLTSTEDPGNSLRGSNADSDGNAPVTVGGPGQNDYTIDAGWRLPQLVSIGDFVWIDDNDNGVQDDGEPVVADIPVVLKDAAGNEVARTTTDVDGFYSFTDLTPSTDYTVVFPKTVDVAGATYVLVDAEQGGDSAKDSNPDAEGVATVTTPAEGNNLGEPELADDPTIDAGYKLITPSIGVAKNAAGDDSTEVEAGSTQTVTVTITNDGSEDLTGFEFVDVTDSGADVVWDLGQIDVLEAVDFVLAVDDSYTVEGTVVVAAGETHSDTVTINAEGVISGAPVTGDDPTTYVPVEEPEPLEPGFELIKISDPVSGTEVAAGETVEYTVLATNTGDLVLDPVNITDDLTDVLNNAGYNNDASANLGTAVLLGNELTWTGSLEPGQSVEITYSVTINADATDVVINNVVNGDATPQIPEDPTDPDSPTEPGDPIIPPEQETKHPVPGEPGFELIKTSDPVSGTQVTAGETVEYTVLATNTGDLVLDPVDITDDLSEVLNNAEYNNDVRATSGMVLLSGEELLWAGSLEPGQSVEITYSVTINADAAGIVINNVVNGEATPQEPLDPFDPESPTIPGEPIIPPEQETKHPVPAVPAFELSKTSDPVSGTQVVPGEVVTYTVTATNTGGLVLEPVNITDDLSNVFNNAGYNDDVSATLGTAVVNGDELTWTGSLEPGQSVEITYSVTINADAAGIVINNVVNGEATPQIPEDPTDPNSPTEPGTPITPPEQGTEHPTPDNEPKVSVGDYVWEDTNRDGIQDPDEPGIKDVELTVTRTDDKPVVDVNGDPVDPTTTDENGNYSFDDLPVLPEGVKYVVTVTKAPEGMEPTIPGAGEDAEKDSSTTSATARELKEDGERDPSLDFGFVTPVEPTKPKVSIGDLVWFDYNSDGLQDSDEPGIPDVVLGVTRTDDKPVVDVNGDPVDPTTTDENGNYSFDDLPVLPEGVKYVVTILEAPAGLEATTPGAGDPAKDSSTGSETARELKEDGERDPTLDFGFRLMGKTTIAKTVTGIKGDDVSNDPNATFQVTATWIDENGIERSQIIDVAPGQPVTMSGLPLNTDITLSETGASTDVSNVNWNDVIWSGEGVTDENGDSRNGTIVLQEQDPANPYNPVDVDLENNTGASGMIIIPLPIPLFPGDAVPGTPTPVDPQPVDPQVPGDTVVPTEPTEPTEPTKPADPVVGDKGGLAVTGANVIGLALGAILIMLIGLAFILRGRRNHS